MADAMEQELSEMFDDVIEAIPESEPVEEPEAVEPEVAEELADESESELERVEEEPEAVVEDQETQQVEEVVEEQPDADDVAGADDVDDQPVDDSAALREQNAALLERIESLSGQVIGGVMQPATQAAEPKEVSQAQAPALVPTTPAAVQNYLENTSIDDLLENPDKFNAVLNNVAQRSQAAGVQEAVQQVLRSVPELVMGYITRHSAMNRMVDDFYKENSDLADVKQTVAAVANDVHSKNPGLGVEEVFKQSAEATRKLLGLKLQATKAVKRKPSKPAFAKTGGARKAAPKVSAVQSEIDNLLNGDF
jgi:hypothetical protein